MILYQKDTNISKSVNFPCFENNLKFKNISAPHKQYSVFGNHSNPPLLLFTLEFLVFVSEMFIASLLMLSAILHKMDKVWKENCIGSYFRRMTLISSGLLFLSAFFLSFFIAFDKGERLHNAVGLREFWSVHRHGFGSPKNSSGANPMCFNLV